MTGGINDSIPVNTGMVNNNSTSHLDKFPLWLYTNCKYSKITVHFCTQLLNDALNYIIRKNIINYETIEEINAP